MTVSVAPSQPLPPAVKLGTLYNVSDGSRGSCAVTVRAESATIEAKRGVDTLRFALSAKVRIVSEFLCIM